jgi:LuxR family transcriptional regulator, maltose regulon positive regulatory protein
MSTPILATKLYRPRLRPNLVSRLHLIERLNAGLHRKLTLISAPAGFGKTTLVSAWIQGIERPTAWLSLDEGENDLARFLTYFVAAVQTLAPTVGEGVLHALQSPQPPPPKALLVALLNDLTTIKDSFVLVLDDYHVIDAQPVDQALAYLVEHLPSHMHLVITTREDPHLPLARLRAQDHMTELRAADLRFTSSEAAAFLTQVMGLALSDQDIAALERRTEGWIAGLQFAALAMQRHQDMTRFIASFTGSHHFVLDYLMEEVLGRQDAHIQTFLLRTSILDRLCGLLCDAVLLDASASGQATLEYLERANLFIVPLDNERRWYRYHHLFADLLRLRLHQSIASSLADTQSQVNELHLRASVWYENQGLLLEAFHQAAAANDVERAERLMESQELPQHFPEVVKVLLDWLASLPKTVLDARPSLWVEYAALSLVNSQTTGVEEKLQAAETALEGVKPDDKTADLIGRIAAARATLALTHYQVESMLVQSRRALEHLHPRSLPFRMTANWTLGFAHQLRGDRAAARQAYTEAIALSQAVGSIYFILLATIGLGNIQEADNQLVQAAETYRHVLHLAEGQSLQLLHEAHLGLARICYEWNHLEAALAHAQQALHLARLYEQGIDRFMLCEVLLARLQLAQGDVTGAATRLAEAAQSARQPNFVNRIPEVAAVQVLVCLRQDNLAAAAHLAQTHQLPLSLARVSLAQGDTSAALRVLESWREQVEAKGWQDERLRVLVLQAVILDAHGEQNQAVHLLYDALRLSEPGGFIRLFVDEGRPMARLLSQAAALGRMPDYIGKLLATYPAEEQKSKGSAARLPPQPLLEPLSPRELEVLQLMAQGRSNQEISERLFLALSTVKGHNRKIFDKLQAQRRTEAITRARELGLL